jgi:hypothetical protein
MVAREGHGLLGLLLEAAEGRFPDVDGGVTVLGPLARGLEVSFGFTGHAVVATALDAGQVRAHGPDGFGGALSPAFLSWLAGPLGSIGSLDVTLVARGRGGGQLSRRLDLDEHPRVALARRLRSDVRVYGDERGVLTLAQGLAGRRELSVEASAEGQGKGAGRSLLEEGLRLVPRGEPVFAAVAPGNARSLRAFLALGFTPIGCEVICAPRRAPLGATTASR